MVDCVATVAGLVGCEAAMSVHYNMVLLTTLSRNAINSDLGSGFVMPFAGCSLESLHMSWNVLLPP